MERDETAQSRGGRIPSGIKILITGIVTSIIFIQFGLAILGWGGWDAFWEHPQFQALLWISIGLGIFATFSGNSGLSTGNQEDRSNRWVLVAFSVIALLMAFFSSYTDRIGFWTPRSPRYH